MTESVRAAERVLDILSCFTRDEPALTLSQIADRVHLPLSTAHRLLASLEKKGFVQRIPENGSYRPGLQLVKIALSALDRENMSEQARPYLHQLMLKHRETVSLAILDGVDVLYLEVVRSPQRVITATAPGDHLPSFCVSAGKAHLAFLPPEEVKRILIEGKRKYPAHRNLSLSALMDELRCTRERGYATVEEFHEGVNAVAAPILDARNHPLAAVVITGPKFRLSREQMAELGESVKATADAIARDVGLTG